MTLQQKFAQISQYNEIACMGAQAAKLRESPEL